MCKVKSRIGTPRSLHALLAACFLPAHPLAYTSRVGKAFKKISALLAIAIVIVLLLSMVTAHGVNHHGVDLFFVSLIPIFLFGIIVQAGTASFWISTRYLPLKPLFASPLLFQLPPPSESH
jgi:hypothetical protein